MKGRYVTGIICCVLLVAIVKPEQASAATGQEWASDPPVVARSQSVVVTTDSFCPSFRGDVRIDGISAAWTACIFAGSHFSFATYGQPNGQWRAAISERWDEAFHPIDGICSGLAGCVYAPETDTLVARVPTPSGYLGAEVFHHVQERITTQFDAVSGHIHHQFDGSRPDGRVADTSGKSLAVGALAVSSNGEWLVVEIRNDGLVRLNMRTFEARRILAPGPMYGVGADPSMELAISNDGTLVASMGLRTSFGLISVDEQCGAELVAPVTHTFPKGVQSCRSVPAQVTSLIPNYKFAAHPVIDPTGQTITFYVVSSNNSRRRIIMTPKVYENTPRLRYMALGDSFTSGEGETSDDHYLSGTNHHYDACHVSDRSYPFVIAALVSMPLPFVHNVACAGARTEDIIADGAFWGQNERLGSGGWQWDEGTIMQKQTEAIESFQPGRALQSIFVSTYQPQTVTVGIGGNDAGFMAKLKTCAMPDTCEWVANPTLKRQVGEEIQAMYDRLVSFYRRLVALSPLSHFYAVGYPDLVTTESQCDSLLGILLNSSERSLLHEGVRFMNQVIRAAAHTIDIPYIDSEASLVGGQLCQRGGSADVNGLRFGDDFSPFSGLPLLRIIGSETFHPTPAGHAKIARTALVQYPDFGATDGCGCQHPTSAPPLSAYWGEAYSSTHRLLRNEAFLRKKGDTQWELTFPAHSFQPMSPVQVELHSNPVLLGKFSVQEDGSLQAVVQLPPDVEEGFHAIHAYAMTNAGQALDIYDVVMVEGKMPEDPPSPEATPESKNPEEYALADRIVSSGHHPKVNYVAVPRFTDVGSTFSMPGVLGVMTQRLSDQAKMLPERISWVTGVILGVVLVIIIFLIKFISGRGG